jgi:hypothetical protein
MYSMERHDRHVQQPTATSCCCVRQAQSLLWANLPPWAAASRHCAKLLTCASVLKGIEGLHGVPAIQQGELDVMGAGREGL